MKGTAAPSAGEVVLVRELVNVIERVLDTLGALTETNARHVHEEPIR